MKRTLRVVIAAFMLMLCMTGCGKEQDELLDYLNGNARKEVTKLEQKARDSYASVTSDNYKDDATAVQELSTNTADLLKQTVDKAADMGKKLEGEKLKKIHEQYVTSLKDLQSGVDQFVQAMEDGDADKMTQVNEVLGKSNDGRKKYQEDLKKLAKELDVEIQNK